jgi:glucose/arabinose dehydrogenase
MPVEDFMKWLIVGTVAGVATAASAAPQTYPSSAGNLMVETIATGLANPWALAFLPDGRLVVTERVGRIRIVGKDGRTIRSISVSQNQRAGAAAQRSRARSSLTARRRGSMTSR